MVIVLGLGFTGRRLARRLVGCGEQVFAAVRGVDRFRDLAGAGVELTELEAGASGMPRQAILAHLIPPLPEPGNAALHEMIEALEPRRVVYVSSTGVYGDQLNVDATTTVQPTDERGRKRLEEERWITSQRWSSLVLRAAAIYGPGRGVHVALREGKVPRGIGSGMVSRIHVEDLAALIDAGIHSDLEGAWPVADDDPCSTDAITDWCAERFGIVDFVRSGAGPSIPGRKVDSTMIRAKLGVNLQYPSWRTGIPASLQEEEKS
ncbi:MAG TPA: hypothetical protein VK789_21115 [Bryobacteraceae bacterium]|nr:hypothetical protein [Bryobacteraceae bacterium]